MKNSLNYSVSGSISEAKNIYPDILKKYYNLSLSELLFIRTAADFIQVKNEQIISNIPLKEIEKIIGIDPFLKKTSALIKKIRKKDISIEINEKIVFANWILKGELNKVKRVLSVYIPFELLNFYLFLQEKFSAYELETAVSLKNSINFRIYKLLKQAEIEGLNKRIISLDSLKDYLGMNRKYKLYADFKKRVLYSAEQEFKTNSKCDIIFDYEEIKEGKKVKYIDFLIKRKK